MKLSIIVAMSKNRVIGRGGQLPWRLSADLQRFKRLTMGHPMIMGRKTFQSIGRILPGRTSIVITRQTTFQADGVWIARSLLEAIRLAEGSDEVFVIGGGEIYSQALSLADRLYLTEVEVEIEGDTFFPALDLGEWQVMDETIQPADDKNAYPMRFQILDRIRPNAGQTNSNKETT